jgi:hypothetical protein
MICHSLREPVRLMMHLNEGYTRVLLERSEGVGLANFGIFWDTPTQVIPPRLRALSSRFIVVTEAVWPEPCDTARELLDAISYQVEELEDT